MRKVILISNPYLPDPSYIFQNRKEFQVQLCPKVSEALPLIKEHAPNLVIIDSDYQEPAALELCFLIRNQSGFRKIKTIVISSSMETEREIDFFKSGADDYVRKPFANEGFFARLLARCSDQAEIAIQEQKESTSRLYIDKEAYSVYLDQKLITLSKKEFELLHLLAGQPGKALRKFLKKCGSVPVMKRTVLSTFTY